MATRHSITPILPFPLEINRQHFGSWLTGFCDGECHFGLGMCIDNRTQVQSPAASFSIGLRADDLPALELVRSFLGCGTIRQVKWRKSPVLKANPQMIFCVTRATDLVGRIIPHMHTCPLLAKKKRDFEIWKKGVVLLHHVAQRKRKGVGRAPGTHRGRGFYPKWTAAELAEFDAFRTALKAVRVYNAVTLPPPRPPRPEPPSLFDGLP